MDFRLLTLICVFGLAGRVLSQFPQAASYRCREDEITTTNLIVDFRLLNNNDTVARIFGVNPDGTQTGILTCNYTSGDGMTGDTAYTWSMAVNTLTDSPTTTTDCVFVTTTANTIYKFMMRSQAVVDLDSATDRFYEFSCDKNNLIQTFVQTNAFAISRPTKVLLNPKLPTVALNIVRDSTGQVVTAGGTEANPVLRLGELARLQCLFTYPSDSTEHLDWVRARCFDCKISYLNWKNTNPAGGQWQQLIKNDGCRQNTQPNHFAPASQFTETANGVVPGGASFTATDETGTFEIRRWRLHVYLYVQCKVAFCTSLTDIRCTTNQCTPGQSAYNNRWKRDATSVDGKDEIYNVTAKIYVGQADQDQNQDSEDMKSCMQSMSFILVAVVLSLLLLLAVGISIFLCLRLSQQRRYPSEKPGFTNPGF